MAALFAAMSLVACGSEQKQAEESTEETAVEAVEAVEVVKPVEKVEAEAKSEAKVDVNTLTISTTPVSVGTAEAAVEKKDEGLKVTEIDAKKDAPQAIELNKPAKIKVAPGASEKKDIKVSDKGTNVPVATAKTK